MKDRFPYVKAFRKGYHGPAFALKNGTVLLIARQAVKQWAIAAIDKEGKRAFMGPFSGSKQEAKAELFRHAERHTLERIQ